MKGGSPEKYLGNSRSLGRQAEEGAVATRQRKLVAEYTPYDANSWLLKLEHSGVKILCDPWFVGPLTFGELEWFYAGSKNKSDVDLDALVADVDFILISQSLNDHLHKPTLRALPKHLPVIGSPEVTATVAALGFTNTIPLDHGQSKTLMDGKLRVMATVGALVGPPWSKRMNGFVLEEPGGVKIYYEPHASYNPSSLQSVAPVDVMITPTTSSYAALYPLVEGREGLPEAVRILRPSVIVSLANNLIKHDGLLAAVLSDKGSNDPAEVEAWLEREGAGGVRSAGSQEFGKALPVYLEAQ